MRYIDMVEKVRTDASVAHSTLRERAPAGTALPADGSDGSLGLVDDGRARRLDGATDDRRATTTARCVSIWYMNVYFCDIYITARPRTPTAATRPGLKASRSASMTVKATAHTEPRGALWSIGCQPSAAASCSPTATHDCSTRPVPQGCSGDLHLLIAALTGW